MNHSKWPNHIKNKTKILEKKQTKDFFWKQILSFRKKN